MLRRFVITFLLIALLAVTTIPAEATKPEPCTLGDAMSLFEAFPVPFQIMKPRGLDEPKLISSVAECQYRVFFDGKTYTFNEDDVFLGGILWLADYKALGISREDAIA